MDQLVITKAKEILKKTNGDICIHCFGRKLSTLVKNKTHLQIAYDVCNILNVDLGNTNCQICDNIFDKITPDLFEKIYNKFDYLNIEFETFEVGTIIQKEIKQKDEKLSNELDLNSESIKKHLNRIIATQIASKRNKKIDFNKQDIVVNVNLKNKGKIRIQINPIFIEGKYNKYIRGIPQTKWDCIYCKGKGCEKCNGSGKYYSESVEELLSNHLLEATRGYKSKFHGAGREDIDVRMLGEGRPFVIEIKEPKKRKIDLKELEQKINKINKGKTRYTNLKYCESHRKGQIKESSPKTFKVYKAKVCCDEEYDKSKLEKLKSLNEINQQTPIRVIKRRTDKIRQKHVKKVMIQIINNKTFELTIKTEGGLYIKELISGDKGRTKPNVSEILGVNAVCEQLDVLEVSEK